LTETGTEPRARLGSARGAPLPGRVSKLIPKVRPVIIRFCLDRCKAPARTLRFASWRIQSRSTENSFEFGNDRDKSCKRCGHSRICRTRPLLLTLLSLGADGPPPHLFSVLRGWSRFLYNARSATKTPCTTKSSTKKKLKHLKQHHPDDSGPGQPCPPSRARLSPHGAILPRLPQLLSTGPRETASRAATSAPAPPSWVQSGERGGDPRGEGTRCSRTLMVGWDRRKSSVGAAPDRRSFAQK